MAAKHYPSRGGNEESWAFRTTTSCPTRVCRRWSWRSKKLGHSLPKVSPHRVVQGSPTRRPRTRCRRRAARARQLWEDAENVTNRTGQPPERPADVRDVRPILVGNATGVYEQQDVSARYLEFENLRQDTAYDFLLRPPPPLDLVVGFLCHEVPLSATIGRLVPARAPFFRTVFSVRSAPLSASSQTIRRVP